jgi:hypothetical protein
VLEVPARPGRSRIPKETRDLIREVSRANPLWGAPRIHGELLKVGIDVAQSTVAKYMAKGRRPPSQSWQTFLENHADGIASLDFFLVPTATFKLLFGLVFLCHDRRRLVHVAVTANPTADWISRQISEAFLGTRRRAISSEIAMVPMERSSGGASELWTSGTDLQHRGRRGKMDTWSA